MAGTMFASSSSFFLFYKTTASFPIISCADRCNEENNNALCEYDAGDCCEESCVDSDFECGAGGFDCLDPAYTRHEYYAYDYNYYGDDVEPASLPIPSASPTITQHDEASSDDFYQSVVISAVSVAASVVSLVAAYKIYHHFRKRNTQRYFRAVENDDGGTNCSFSQELTSPMIEDPDDPNFWTNFARQRMYDDGSGGSGNQREHDYDPFSVTAEGFWLVRGDDDGEDEAGVEDAGEGGGDFGDIVGEEAVVNKLHDDDLELEDVNIDVDEKGEILV